MTCYFCDAWTSDVSTAVESDWIPSWWDGRVEIGRPACADCCRRVLEVAPDGEWQIPKGKTARQCRRRSQ